MTIFMCQDSFEGILCGVYDAWMSRLGHANVRLEIEGTGNMQMFAEYCQSEPSGEKVAKVTKAILDKAGRRVYEQVYRVSLSREEEKAERIYRYLIYALHYGRMIVDQIQIPEVYEIFRMNRNVSNEAHYHLEFLRFSQTKEGILLGVIGPKNDILTLVAPHFADRLSGENWVIYDETRKKAVIHKALDDWMVLTLSDDRWRDRMVSSWDQEAFENLWKTFHEHIAIQERRNEACQMNHLPLRYRPYMTEFQRKET